jgi:hypothetical protein
MIEELLKNKNNIIIAVVGLGAFVIIVVQALRAGKNRTPITLEEQKETKKRKWWQFWRWGERETAVKASVEEAVDPDRISERELDSIITVDKEGRLSISLGAAKHPSLALDREDPGYDKAIGQVQERWIQRASNICMTPTTKLETDHFWVYCANDHARTQLANQVEPVLSDLRYALPTISEATLWPGRMPVIQFMVEHEFVTFAEQVDVQDTGVNLNAYFRESDTIGHLAMGRAVSDAAGYLQLVDSLGRACLFYLGAHIKRLPRWVEEGTILSLQANCEYGAGMREDMRRLATRSDYFTKDNFERLFSDEGFEDSNIQISQSAHALSFCVCDFLRRKDPESYTRFLWFLKEIDDQEEILITNYGWGIYDLQEEFQQNYGVHLTEDAD